MLDLILYFQQQSMQTQWYSPIFSSPGEGKGVNVLPCHRVNNNTSSSPWENQQKERGFPTQPLPSSKLHNDVSVLCLPECNTGTQTELAMGTDTQQGSKPSKQTLTHQKQTNKQTPSKKMLRIQGQMKHEDKALNR